MKIAQLCPYDIDRPGGVQRHVVDLSVSLRRLGHRVTIVAPRVAEAVGTSRNPDIGGVFIVQIGRGHLISVNKTRFEITLATGKERIQLDRMLQAGGFDVLHCHSLSSPFLPVQALQSANRAGLASVATFHAVPPETRTGSIQRVLLRALYRRVMPRLHGVILASEVQKRFVPIGTDMPHAVLPPCIDLRRFDSGGEPHERVRGDRINILFLGRLEPRKGPLVLLRAYRELCRKGLPVQLTVAGDGSERAMLERFARAQAVPQIDFLGAIRDADLPGLYAACDIFCAPSLYGEGFGIVLAEAMASGRPIVAAANDGYRTILQHEAASSLVPPGDVPATVSRLEALIADPSLRHRLGSWGRREASRYDSDHLAPAFVDLYEQAQQRNSRAETRS